MKKIICLCIFTCLFCSACINKPYQYTEKDCFEDHICKEGISIIFEGETLPSVISKDTCIKHNYKWNEKTKTCFTINTLGLNH